MPEGNLTEFEREWTELLNELRVALPGVQILFAFLFTVPFTERFSLLHGQTQGLYFACVLLTTGASAFLTAPSVYHRLHWRRDVVDKENMLRTCNGLAIVGIGLLSLAMSTAVFTISSVVFAGPLRVITGATSLMGFGLLWFALPFLRRLRERTEVSR